MKKIFAKWLSALLVVCMLLSPAAFMEEAMSEDISEEAVSVEGTDDSDANIPEEEANEESEKAGEEEIIESAEVDEILPEALDESFEAEEFDLSTYEEEDDFISEEDVAEITTQYEAASTGSIGINETNFPDAKFRTYITETFDRNKDGSLSAEEITAATRISNMTNQPSDLTGIKLLTNLSYLNIGFNPNLTKLDVSGCTSLREISVIGNINNGRGALIELYAGGCTKLETLECEFNQLTKLDISGCVNLYKLICCDNQLSEINMNECPSLDVIDCHNNKLIALDLSQTINLTFLEVNGNPNLTKLDISNCVKILPYLSNVNRSIGDDGVVEYTYDTGDIYVYLCFDKWTQLITPVATSGNITPSGLTWIPMIDATRKNTKVTITAVPGSVYQLDLRGKTGKKFKSSKKKVATVSSTGLVTVKKAGKTKITFKVGKKKRTVTLTVKDPTIPKSVTLGVPTTAVKKGDVITLTASLPAGTNSPIKWKSSNKRVASVSNGVVTFKKAGKVTITATATRGKKKAKVKFKVSK